MSASLNLLTWLGARTRHLRLGTAVLVLPWHNPVLLAEQAATLDLLSGGRLDFGVGKGYRYNEFAGFCVPMEEADARFDEVLEVITKAFISDTPFRMGKFWQFDNIIVEPPPARSRTRRSGWAPDRSVSVRQVAERGYNLLLGQYVAGRGRHPPDRAVQEEVEARGRTYNPMEVGTRPRRAFRRYAAEEGGGDRAAPQGHLRINSLAERPGDERATAFLATTKRRCATSATRPRSLARPTRSCASSRRCALAASSM